MANMFSVTKAERSKLRRLAFLPRIGVVVEVAGRRFSYKQAPLLETILNLKDRGFSVTNLVTLAKEQLAEISFPFERKGATAKAQAIRVVEDEPKAEPKKKNPPKAAARKKPAAEKAPDIV